mmetsp:Transcript_57193/g.139431  ORF Transcript_57193/g.139431 Transcript_57193/m.139431 type:complete len:512 (+) Transcript_57193:77-1612(+)
MEIFGQDLDVLVAVGANILSWFVVTFCPSFLPYLLPKIDVALPDDVDDGVDDGVSHGNSNSNSNGKRNNNNNSSTNTRCIAIGRPGGNEQLRIVTLQEGYATRGYNVILPSEHREHQQLQQQQGPSNCKAKLVASSPFVDITAKNTSNLPPGTVVVKIHSFSVNYADCCIRWGLYESANKFVGWPIVPGFDIAGVVEQVIVPPQPTGEQPQQPQPQSKFQVGDRVYGATFFGGYSTRCLVPTQQLRKIPEGFSFEQAASIPAVSLTALYSLYLGGIYTLPDDTNRRTTDLDEDRRTTKKSILIHSAAGGVGSMMVRMAKLLQMSPVVGVVGRTSKVDAAKQLGCDVVVDKSDFELSSSSSSWWKVVTDTCPNGYAVVADANGVSTIQQSMDVLQPTGRLIVFGFHSNLPMGQDMLNPFAWISMARKMSQMPKFNPMDLVKDNKSILGFNLSFFVDEIELLGVMHDQIGRWLTTGVLEPPRLTSLPMNSIHEAHQLIQSGKSVGKIVMICPP